MISIPVIGAKVQVIFCGVRIGQVSTDTLANLLLRLTT